MRGKELQMVEGRAVVHLENRFENRVKSGGRQVGQHDDGRVVASVREAGSERCDFLQNNI